MKTYIRQILQDLKRPNQPGYIPPIPKPSVDGPVLNMDAAPDAALPEDLSNQDLSADPLERVKQLDFQAQQAEERQSS
jgi:hypothetical protein